MKKTKLDTLKHQFAAATGKAIETAAGFFVAIPCRGDWYEPKVPEKLQK